MFKQDIEWRSGKYTCKVALNTFIRLNVNHKGTGTSCPRRSVSPFCPGTKRLGLGQKGISVLITLPHLLSGPHLLHRYRMTESVRLTEKDLCWFRQ